MTSAKIKGGVLFLLHLAAVAAATALPGVVPYIQDFSGEYVYYADSTFQRTSYVGFLYYNESTYALRYYAPADVERELLPKDITLYVAIDPDADHLALTGERIEGETELGDMDIVNYLHDLLYEFTARRQSAFLEGLAPVAEREDFPQFGGDVTITYSALVPIFNIESIKSADGTAVFQIQTAGLLTDSTDASFTEFAGVDGLPTDKKRAFKKKVFRHPQTARFGSQSVELDAMWKQEMENLWLLGDYALLNMNEIPLSPAYQNMQELYRDTLVRKLCQGTAQSYAVWQQMHVASTEGETRITNTFYQPKEANVTRDVKVLSRREDGSYAFLTLTVFESVYLKNKSYFDGLLKSYRPY